MPKAHSQAESKTYDVSGEELQKRLDQAIASFPRVGLVTEDASTMRKEFVFRTPIFRFPDLVTYQVVPLFNDKSTLAIHSKSIYGGSDLGVNKKRVEEILEKLDDLLPPLVLNVEKSPTIAL